MHSEPADPDSRLRPVGLGSRHGGVGIAYPIRPLRDEEFEPWARMTCLTYGQDWREGGLRNARASIELERTLAAFDDGEIVGGAATYGRVMTVPGGTVPVAGVTLVAVAPTHRRRGILTAMMRRQLDGLHESGGEPIAVLNAAEATIYGRFGYGIASRIFRMRGEKRSMGLRPEVDLGDGRVRLLDADRARPVIEKVYDTARRQAVGWVERTGTFWDARLGEEARAHQGETSFRFAVYERPDGSAAGYALFRSATGADGREKEVRVVELAATDPRAYAAVWRFLIDLDMHAVLAYRGATDEPLPHLLRDPGALRREVVDNLWVRPVDVGRALAARRYAAPLDVVLGVQDAFCPWNAGRYRLCAEGDSVSCERTSAPADLELTSAELGAVFLGGTSLASLAAGQRVRELRPGAVDRCTVAFRGARDPFHPSGAAFPAF